MMDREEFDKLKLPEAEWTFHRNVEEGYTYVTVIWSRPHSIESDVFVTRGFKFIVNNEIMDRIEGRGPDKNG